MGSCKQSATKTEAVAVVPTTPATPTAVAQAHFQAYWVAPTATDTALTLQARTYHLRMQAEMGSANLLIVSDK